jgi:hypothetical protein
MMIHKGLRESQRRMVRRPSMERVSVSGGHGQAGAVIIDKFYEWTKMTAPLCIQPVQSTCVDDVLSVSIGSGVGTSPAVPVCPVGTSLASPGLASAVEVGFGGGGLALVIIGLQNLAK